MIIKHIRYLHVLILYIIIPTISSILASCGTTSHADSNTTIYNSKNDSQYHFISDNIIYYDSIYITQTDTLKQVDKTKYIYRYKYKTDTICKTDTIYKTQYKYVEKKTNNNNMWTCIYKIVIVEIVLGLLSYVIYTDIIKKIK